MTDLPVDVLTSNNANSEMNDTPEAPATLDSQSPPQFCMQTDCVLMRRKLIVTEAKVDDTLDEKARVVEEALRYKTRANKLNMQLDAKIKELRDNHKEVVNNYDEALDDARHKTLLREGEWEAGKIAARESLLKLQDAEADIAYKQALLDRNRDQFERGNARIAKLLEEQAGQKKQISELEARLKDDSPQQAQVISTLQTQLDAEIKAKSQLSTNLDIRGKKVSELENRIAIGEKAYYEMLKDRNFQVEELGWLNGWTTYLESDLREEREASNIARERDAQIISRLQCDLQNALACNITLIAETKNVGIPLPTRITLVLAHQPEHDFNLPHIF
jgi:chromosome segregation ATPase